MADAADESAAARDRLLFDIRRSARYHDRRRAFFEWWHRLTNFVTILLAGAVLSEILGRDSPPILKVLAGIGALLGAADLVVGFAGRGQKHRSFRQRFIELEKLLHGDEAATSSVQESRLNIESEEPPIYRGLDVLTHNEVCIAMGYERCEQYKVPPCVRWTANFLHWPNFAPTPLEPRNQLPNDSQHAKNAL